MRGGKIFNDCMFHRTGRMCISEQKGLYTFNTQCHIFPLHKVPEEMETYGLCCLINNI